MKKKSVKAEVLRNKRIIAFVGIGVLAVAIIFGFAYYLGKSGGQSDSSSNFIENSQNGDDADFNDSGSVADVKSTSSGDSSSGSSGSSSSPSLDITEEESMGVVTEEIIIACSEVCSESGYDLNDITSSEVECDNLASDMDDVFDNFFNDTCCCMKTGFGFDADYNEDIYVEALEKSGCVYDGGTGHDICFGSDLIEYHYDGESCKYTEINCPSHFGANWICDDGACVEDDPYQECSDYCVGLLRSEYNTGTCYLFDSRSGTEEELCVSNHGNFLSGSVGKCDSGEVCCCK
jgi:hypothetical protein